MSRFGCRTGRVALSAALLSILTIGASTPSARAQEPTPATPPAQQPSAVLDSVVVRGNQRVSEAAIRTTTGLRAGSVLR
ncbi:MAG TPA: hypothetical protein VK399_12890, partial [Longimicrobiaceae bacterium]|nr:hypothetical protein [Longimicrobiaceae bacterium]